MESDYYLFALSSEASDRSARAVFYVVKGERMANSLCELFTREYVDADGTPSFGFEDGGSFSVGERVLMDESLDSLLIYDDPDPGIYDPPPPAHIMTLAQYAVRAKKWEQLLRERIRNLEPNVDPDKTEAAPENDSPTADLPVMPPEERRNSGLVLLMLLAQAYYKMLESSISMASWCSALDIELNQSYFWTVTMMTNLLKNHEDLKDFPVAFEPIFPDLYPSTIRDVDWEEMIAPDAESFLSTVQQYVHSKGIYDPEQGSSAWVFIEMYRPGVNKAIERANAYHKRMREYYRQMIGVTPSESTMTEDTRTVKKTVVEVDLVGYSSISNNLEESLDVSTVAQINQQIQSFIEVGLEAANASRQENVMSLTGDGAILIFDSAQQAHLFAEALHRATQEHNQTRKEHLAKRVFRSGAASGEISMRRKAGGGYDIAGSTIARAVRLEAKASPGGILVDKTTFEALSAAQRQRYGSRQIVSGKRDERFEAYASQLSPDGARDAAFFTGAAEKNVRDSAAEAAGGDKRRQILSAVKALKSHQYLELVFLLEIPIGQRPAETLNLDQQKAQILKWAEENQMLDAVLQVLGELAETKSRTSGAS